MNRRIVWFSCGAASAVAAKLATEQSPCEVVYCDTFKYEHPDNIRFMHDIEEWIGQKIIVLKSNKYSDIMAVFNGERYIVGIAGAPCTRCLKRDVRIRYSRPTDIHIFGLTSDETHRIAKFEKNNSQLWLEWILLGQNITKSMCYQILQNAGIELPAMYKLGYKNNNCIGCVKGGAGYWNKIRRDFPERFNEMADLEKEIGATICKYKGKRIYLHDLPVNAGRYKEEDIECGVLCLN